MLVCLDFLEYLLTLLVTTTVFLLSAGSVPSPEPLVLLIFSRFSKCLKKKQIPHETFQKCQFWYGTLLHAIQDPEPWLDLKSQRFHLDLTALGVLQEYTKVSIQSNSTSL
jgi:hypothetical protein